MRDVFVFFFKLFGLMAVFTFTLALGFVGLFAITWDMAPAAASEFRHTYQLVPALLSVLTVLCTVKFAFRERPRRLNSVDILEVIDADRRLLPRSSGQTLLKASRVDPVRRRDGTWLVYAGPRVGEVHYQPGRGRYRHMPALGEPCVYRDAAELVRKIDLLVIEARPARRAA